MKTDTLKSNYMPRTVKELQHGWFDGVGQIRQNFQVSLVYNSFTQLDCLYHIGTVMYLINFTYFLNKSINMPHNFFSVQNKNWFPSYHLKGTNVKSISSNQTQYSWNPRLVSFQ